MRRTAFVAAAIALLGAGPAVHAAGAPRACTGYVDSLPAVIATSGVWCLRRPLTTSLATGAAIDIQANDVTLYCDRFWLDIPMGSGSSAAVGVRAVGRDGVTIERCGVAGFGTGIRISGGTGHRVENNSLSRSHERGIVVSGERMLVRENSVMFRGVGSVGIQMDGSGDVERNDLGEHRDPSAIAMRVSANPGGAVYGNRFQGSSIASESSVGLDIRTSPGAIVRGNRFGRMATAAVCDADDIVMIGNAYRDGRSSTGCDERAGPIADIAPSVATEPGETTATCTGYVDSLPAVIGSSGNWCLRADLGTAMRTGVAIEIAASQATLDCRGHRLNNLAAGSESGATGIQAEYQMDVVIRDCTLQGFGTAIEQGSRGYPGVIEDNRSERATYAAIKSRGAVVRRNEVRDVGGALAQRTMWGVHGPWERPVESNRVGSIAHAGADDPDNDATGISGGDLSGNRVRHVDAPQPTAGLSSLGGYVVGNVVQDVDYGVVCQFSWDSGDVFLSDNVVAGADSPYGMNCRHGGNGVELP